jgi:hypothetical protein
MENIEEREPDTVITSDTPNATKIQPKEAPPGRREKFRKFRKYNTGMWNGPKRENKQQVFHQDNLHRYDSISSSLNLSGYQKQRGRSLIEDFDFRELGCSVDGFLFGICVLVVNDNLHDSCRYYPNPEASGDSDFEDMADTLGLDRGDQISFIEKARSCLDF